MAPCGIKAVGLCDCVCNQYVVGSSVGTCSPNKNVLNIHHMKFCLWYLFLYSSASRMVDIKFVFFGCQPIACSHYIP